jgi:hypothetical protein
MGSSCAWQIRRVWRERPTGASHARRRRARMSAAVYGRCGMEQSSRSPRPPFARRRIAPCIAPSCLAPSCLARHVLPHHVLPHVYGTAKAPEGRTVCGRAEVGNDFPCQKRRRGRRGRRILSTSRVLRANPRLNRRAGIAEEPRRDAVAVILAPSEERACSLLTAERVGAWRRRALGSSFFSRSHGTPWTLSRPPR